MSIPRSIEYSHVYHTRTNNENFDRNYLETDAESTEQNLAQVRNVCRYFLNGNCRFGDFCRNSHNIQPNERSPVQPVSVPANTNNNSRTVSNELSRNWIDAPEFIPRQINQNTFTNQPNIVDDGAPNQNTTISYAQIVSGNTDDSNGAEMFPSDAHSQSHEYMESTLCPYIHSTITRSDGSWSCKYGELCKYQHGDLCEMCGLYCLHPIDQKQRKAHEKECMSILEKDMEHSFAVARSKDKTCGICFEVITEKAHRGEHRFGILPNCNHIFCLPCIRKWRQAKNFDSTITRACPECRIESHYVCPSLYWVDTKEEKEKLLNEYKDALQKQNCKYFNRGEGTCPFGNKCFYKHALPNGEMIDVGIPQQRRRFDLHGESNIVERVILWNFLQARDSFSDDDDDDTESSFSDPSDLD